MWEKLESLIGCDIEQIAKTQKFIQRSSAQLKGKDFLHLHICHLPSGEASLTDLCEALYEDVGVLLSKQGLDYYFNTHSVGFMRNLVEKLMVLTLGQQPVMEGRFSAIKIIDSTSFQLPAHLATFYSGNGGSNSGSSVKIHQCYELLSGKIANLTICDGKSADVSYWQAVQPLPNELYITDLGYWKVGSFADISAQGAYFISRYKSANLLYHRTAQGIYEAFDLRQVLTFVKKPTVFEVHVGEQKLAVRLIVEPVSEVIKQQRIKKTNQKITNQSKQKYAYQMSRLKKQLCGYNVFITNLTEEMLPFTQIRDFYRLRWQIELLFKIWKSILKIDKIKQMSIFRFECYLYAKLIILLASTEVQVFARVWFKTGNQ